MVYPTMATANVLPKCYPTSNRLRGKALIIINKKFPNPMDERTGREEMNNMIETFKHLGFNVVTFFDQTAQQMTENIKSASEDKDNFDSDCFVLAIASHGDEYHFGDGSWIQSIKATDGNIVYMDGILDTFAKSESLKNKPKLFFIQTCRSNSADSTDELDIGFEVQCRVETGKVETESEPKKGATDALDDPPRSGPTLVPAQEPIECPKDCLVMYPCQPHKVAHTDKNAGSNLFEIMNTYMDLLTEEKRGLMHYLTRVTNEMANEEFLDPNSKEVETYKTSATLVHRLIGDVFFPTKPKE